MTQPTLFVLPKPVLVLQLQDAGVSEDPLERHLQRKGWDLKRVVELQNSISEKRTVDMFSGKTRELSRPELELQSDIQDYLDQL